MQYEPLHRNPPSDGLPSAAAAVRRPETEDTLSIRSGGGVLYGALALAVRRLRARSQSTLKPVPNVICGEGGTSPGYGAR